jgi:uncharacterized repeat protein (TIGR03803 family)
MYTRKLSLRVTTLALIAIAFLASGTKGFAQREKTVYTFSNSANGATPQAGLVSDSSGNLFGTTWAGGANQYGVVYELSHSGSGWTQKVLHNFANDGLDGARSSASLTFDAAGNLYGTTYTGGAYFFGTVFKLSPNSDGSWTEEVLHSFNQNGVDGIYPQSALVADAAGNLYGTTPQGGTGSCTGSENQIVGCGTVYRLAPNSDGSWTETIVYSFVGGLTDGQGPYAAVTLDAAANIYGTTIAGGKFSNSPACSVQFCAGTVYEIKPSGPGKWSEQILHNFNDNHTDGFGPAQGLVLHGGNLYGVTSSGGHSNGGTVFELSPSGGRVWTETILYNFSGRDGLTPSSSVIFDATGNLYGETSTGGASLYGTVYELKPQSGGGWTESVLQSFGGPTVGLTRYPRGGLIRDSAGDLFGTDSGMVFEIIP